MGKIKENTSRLSKDAHTIQTCINNINSTLGDISDHVKELDKMWDGPGSEQFKKAFHDDIEKAQTMISNLTKLYTYETNAQGKYEECESKVGQLVDEIKV